jgi:hypothetical protein
MRGRFADAIADWNRALACDPTFADAFTNRKRRPREVGRPRRRPRRP